MYRNFYSFSLSDQKDFWLDWLNRRRGNKKEDASEKNENTDL